MKLIVFNMANFTDIKQLKKTFAKYGRIEQFFDIPYLIKKAFVPTRMRLTQSNDDLPF